MSEAALCVGVELSDTPLDAQTLITPQGLSTAQVMIFFERRQSALSPSCKGAQMHDKSERAATFKAAHSR